MAEDCRPGAAACVMFMKSKKPKKQRKAFHEKPLHARQREVASHLAKKLAGELSMRAIPLRTGDSVKVMRGGFKGKSGKVSRVDYSKMQVFVEKLSRRKADGTEVLVAFKASNLLVESLEKGDEKRLKKLRRAKEGKEGKKAGEEKSAEKEKGTIEEKKEAGEKKGEPAEKEEKKEAVKEGKAMEEPRERLSQEKEPEKGKTENPVQGKEKGDK